MRSQHVSAGLNQVDDVLSSSANLHHSRRPSKLSKWLYQPMPVEYWTGLWIWANIDVETELKVFAPQFAFYFNSGALGNPLYLLHAPLQNAATITQRSCNYPTVFNLLFSVYSICFSCRCWSDHQQFVYHSFLCSMLLSETCWLQTCKQRQRTWTDEQEGSFFCLGVTPPPTMLQTSVSEALLRLSMRGSGSGATYWHLHGTEFRSNQSSAVSKAFLFETVRSTAFHEH